jgi:hypothetical protein
MRKFLVLLVVLLIASLIIGALPASADDGLPGQPWNRPSPGQGAPCDPPGWSQQNPGPGGSDGPGEGPFGP